MKQLLLQLGRLLGKAFIKYTSYKSVLLMYIHSGALSRQISIESLDRFSAEYPSYFVGGDRIHIASGRIRRFSRISAICRYNDVKYDPHINIGSNANIGMNTHIGAIDLIQIGDNFLTGANCLITDHAHGSSTYEELFIAPNDRVLYSKGPIHIGDNVHIGENVIILPNVTIGNNVIVGAGSIVTKNLPDNVVACGNPAKIVKTILK